MNLPAWRPPESNVCRNDFDYTDFRKAVFTKGLRFWWELGTPCPCRALTSIGTTDPHDTDTLQPDNTCSGCDGTGVLFQSGQFVRGIASGLSDRGVLTGKFSNFMRPGDLHVSLLREHEPDVNDRFMLIDDPAVWTETRKREAGVGELEELRFPIVTKKLRLGTGNGDEEEQPAWTEVRVLSMRVAGTDGKLLERTLQDGIDFEIVDGRIDWTLGDARGTAPPIGGYLGVRYYTYQVYKVSERIHSARVSPYLLEDGVTEELGDGPIEVILSPVSLSTHDNPSATFLPDLSCCAV